MGKQALQPLPEKERQNSPDSRLAVVPGEELERGRGRKKGREGGRKEDVDNKICKKNLLPYLRNWRRPNRCFWGLNVNCLWTDSCTKSSG